MGHTLTRLACGTVLVAAVAVHAQAPVAPTAAVAAARAALSDTTRGAELRVVLLTAGYGEDEVWDRFGHNLLWITNARTGESVAWNWGLFNFDQPWFITRFLFGHTRYMMDSVQVGPYLNHYRRQGREVVAQDLVLTAGQRSALDALVRANVRGEDQFYRYDYFLDNCSTRLRDALDIVLNGAIRQSLELRSDGAYSYRGETLRLVQTAPWFFLGMDLALGAPADASLNPWQLAYIPTRLRDALRTVTVLDADGMPVSLVRNERVLVPSTRAPVPDDYRSARWPMWVLAGSIALSIAIAGLAMLGARRVRGASAAAVTLSIGVHLVFGALASLIVFMWLFTKHTFWAWNHHLLLFTPLSLVVAAALPFARRNLGHRRLIAVYHLVLTAGALLLFLSTLIWYEGRPSPAAGLFLVWATASGLLHLAIGTAVRRLQPPAAPPPLA